MASRDSPPRTLQPKTCIACGSRGLVLTDREIEVLRALADGLSDSEIGAKLTGMASSPSSEKGA